MDSDVAMAETFSWLRLAVKAAVVLAAALVLAVKAAVLAAALVLAVLAKAAELEAKAVVALAVEKAAQAAECSPDRAVRADTALAPKAARSAAGPEKAELAEPEKAR